MQTISKSAAQCFAVSQIVLTILLLFTLFVAAASTQAANSNDPAPTGANKAKTSLQFHPTLVKTSNYVYNNNVKHSAYAKTLLAMDSHKTLQSQ